MKPRLLIICWLGLLLPAVTTGVLLYRMLLHEQELIVQSRVAAANDQAQAVAANVAFAVADLKTQILTGAQSVPLEGLTAWRDWNPLTRNVFAWREDAGLLVPGGRNGLTDEETQFVLRYEALFSGRQPWPTQATLEEQSPVQSVYRPNLEVRAWNTLNQPAVAQGEAAVAAPVETGWVPWFSGNQLFFIGWIDWPAQGLRTGVELETAALLSRVLSILPAEAPEGTTYALVDGNGAMVWQRGEQELDGQVPVTASAQIGAELPHWSIAVYADQATAAAGRAFSALGFIITGTFVIAIVASGTLLLWQARRNLLDARRKTTFVSNVSHELKTPLTTIRMYAEMLGEGRVREEGRRAEYLNTMVRESQRLTRLVNNVLDFSRLEEGRKRYRFERLDLVEIVREVLDTQAERFREAGLDVAVEADDDTCSVNADRDAVGQIVLNLVDNAVKYAAGGGRLRVQLKREGDTCAISFVDNGPGVPVAHRDRIFEQFHRADDSLTTDQAGCGLGLSIARRLARDHEGDLDYNPEPGGGSRFTLSLPTRRTSE